MAARVPYQPSLFGHGAPSFDPAFAGIQRTALDATAWIEHLPGWVRGADDLLDDVLKQTRWGQRTRWMYERKVLEPRLTSHWSLASGEPLEPEILERMRRALSERYGVVFDTVGKNLYRDGRDSVAWHGDRIRKDIAEPIVVLVSLGEPRKLHFRPRRAAGGAGASRAFPLGRGDLLVTGGTTQRTWEHAIPKVARAGPRISLAFRHGLEPRAYDEAETGET